MTPTTISRSVLPRAAVLLARLLRLALYLFILALPTLVLRYHTANPQLHLDLYRPAYFDEHVYWHQAGTYLVAGWGGGYYTFEEMPAALAFTRFDLHGPWYPVVYALFGYITGTWDYTSVLYANILYLSLMLLAVLWVWRPRLLPTLLIAGLLTTWHPLHIYTLTSMTELLHLGFGAVLAVLFIRVLNGQPLSRQTFWLAIVLLVVLSTFRLFWALLLPPLLLFTLRDRRWPTVRRQAVILAISSVVILILYRSLNAVYPYYAYMTMLNDIAFNPTLDNIVHQVRNRVEYNWLRSAEGPLFERIGRWQALAGVAAGAVGGMLLLTPARLKRLLTRLGLIMPPNEAIFHIWNLGVMMLIQVFLYDMYDNRDYRMFMPHLLLSLLVLIGRRRYAWAVAIALLGVIGAAEHYETGYGWIIAGNFSLDRVYLENVRTALEPLIVYRPAANGWCNTVTMFSWDPAVMELPFGIGYNKSEHPARYVTAPRSRYFILRPPELEQLRLHIPALPLRQIGTSPLGDVYINDWAACR